MAHQVSEPIADEMMDRHLRIDVCAAAWSHPFAKGLSTAHASRESFDDAAVMYWFAG